MKDKFEPRSDSMTYQSGTTTFFSTGYHRLGSYANSQRSS